MAAAVGASEASDGLAANLRCLARTLKCDLSRAPRALGDGARGRRRAKDAASLRPVMDLWNRMN